jgi:hypothetical protein
MVVTQEILKRLQRNEAPSPNFDGAEFSFSNERRNGSWTEGKSARSLVDWDCE